MDSIDGRRTGLAQLKAIKQCTFGKIGALYAEIAENYNDIITELRVHLGARSGQFLVPPDAIFFGMNGAVRYCKVEIFSEQVGTGDCFFRGK